MLLIFQLLIILLALSKMFVQVDVTGEMILIFCYFVIRLYSTIIVSHDKILEQILGLFKKSLLVIFVHETNSDPSVVIIAS